ncbi:flap endonuclease Xni [Pseudoalteromonas fenneropenaei]|uniref:Flap endonuclease Xni n=1 Tax=Pseudoalteromonas fenneropenaei TaxID=1737459 RepID=A0ABV7CM91_9GAMM
MLEHSPTFNVLIIDALNLIRRIYAVEEKQHSQADALIVACRARISNAVKRLMKLHAFSHAVAVFDGRASWRYEYYPLYKATRAPMPELLQHRLHEVAEGFTQAGVFCYHPEQDEADDIIATFASKIVAAKGHAVIVSTDKGFLPLISADCQIYDYFQQKWLDVDFVVGKFQVELAQLHDYWALVGDKSNDIPGVKGIGKQTAIQLLKDYPDVQSALNSATLAPNTLQKLLADLDSFVLSKVLVSLRQDISLGLKLREIRINPH